MPDNEKDLNTPAAIPPAGLDSPKSIPGLPPLETAPIKRGRGRPRGPLGLTRPPAAPGAAGPAAAPAGSEPAGNIAMPIWTAENSSPIGQLPFLVAGIATGWDGWKLEEKEADAVAEPLAQVLNALIPSGGKYAAVIALSATLMVVGGAKYKGYREHLEAAAKKALENARVNKS